MEPWISLQPIFMTPIFLEIETSKGNGVTATWAQFPAEAGSVQERGGGR
jgi:hypothetical protein